MTEERFDTYDFIINDEDETMLLLYARDSAPKNPTIALNIEEQKALLIRNDEDSICLNEIPTDVLDSLQDADKLLVCELNMAKDEKETKIVYAYEAEITD